MWLVLSPQPASGLVDAVPGPLVDPTRRATRNLTVAQRRPPSYAAVALAAYVTSDPRPVEQLRKRLARDRAAGATFEDAWRPATRTVLAGVASDLERDLWASALKATEPAWRDAYEGQAAALALSPALLDH